MTTLAIIAKPPLPGRAKTRLHPPLTLDEAAAVARASLLDTLDAARTLDADERVLVWDGAALPVYAQDFALLPQCTGGLDERIAGIFDALPGPTVMMGMDTPQAGAAHLAPALAPWPTDVDAWFGPATDGGFWALALGDIPSRSDLVRGVPMSTPATGRILLERLRAAGLRVGMLPELTDIDDIDSARAVAACVPLSRVARELARVDARLAA